MHRHLRTGPAEAIFLQITQLAAHGLVSLRRNEGQTKSVMQYTGESFAEGLESLASTFNSDIVEGRVVDKGEIFPPAVRG